MTNQEKIKEIELSLKEKELIEKFFLQLANEHNELVCQLSRHRIMLNKIYDVCGKSDDKDLSEIKEYALHVLEEKPIRTVSEMREIDWKSIINS
jgi:hypothetical protein